MTWTLSVRLVYVANARSGATDVVLCRSWVVTEVNVDNLVQLEAQIRERLSAVQVRTLQAQDAAKEEMEELQLRSEQFWEVTRRLLDDIICPRMRLLKELFPKGRLTLADGVKTSVCVCSFDHTPDYPASTKLEIGVLPDLPNKTAIIGYSLEILPIFFDFTRHDQIALSLHEVDQQEVSSWLDSKLLQFTDTYLQVRSLEQYQRDNMVTDPVCGMSINSGHAAASVDHGGKTYYFCIDDCRRKFVQDPTRYLAHR